VNYTPHWHLGVKFVSYIDRSMTKGGGLAAIVGGMKDKKKTSILVRKIAYPLFK